MRTPPMARPTKIPLPVKQVLTAVISDQLSVTATTDEGISNIQQGMINAQVNGNGIYGR